MSLSIRNLSAGYPRRLVLTGIDLAPIPPGTMVALLGANAAGKSTLLKALCGLLSASGTAHLGEVDLLALPRPARQKLLSYVPQTPLRPSSLLVYEFVLASLKAAGLDIPDLDARIETVFARFALTDLGMQPLASLSGGKRQLVAASLALIRRPGLLLLDEPTSALDLKWQIELLAALRDNGRQTGAITLVAMHEINLALRHADHVVMLTGGQVAAAGRPGDVLTADVLRNAYDIEARIERLADGTPIVVAERSGVA